ncbi:MAG: hypothetical protein JXQ84_10855, partial [Rhodospirillaceae bacterium]|nr:hypothetical protein [Rhodospirillaceae bacterium]
MSTAFAAYSVYYYDANYNGHGMVGRIAEMGGTTVYPDPDLRQGFNGDPKVEGFAESSTALRIAATDYVKNDPNRTVYIYDAYAGGTALNTPTWSSVTNLYSLVKLGSYLYAMDYDNARVVEIDPSNGYAQSPNVSYTLDSNLVPSGYVGVGQALMVIGSTLYGLFSCVDDPSSYNPTYTNSILVKFSVTGGSSIGLSSYNAGLQKNAFAMDVYNTDIYVVSIGGAQGSGGTPNGDSRIQKIDYTGALGSATVYDVMSPSAENPYEFRDISFKGSTAYIMMGTYNTDQSGNWVMNGKLVSTTNFSTLTTIDTISAVKAYFWSAQYTSVNDRIWYARGNEIWLYTAADTSAHTTLTLSVGSLLSNNELYPYDNINDLAFVGQYGTTKAARGYRSPLQASRSPRAVAL